MASGNAKVATTVIASDFTSVSLALDESRSEQQDGRRPRGCSTLIPRALCFSGAMSDHMLTSKMFYLATVVAVGTTFAGCARNQTRQAAAPHQTMRTPDQNARLLASRIEQLKREEQVREARLDQLAQEISDAEARIEQARIEAEHHRCIAEQTRLKAQLTLDWAKCTTEVARFEGCQAKNQATRAKGTALGCMFGVGAAFITSGAALPLTVAGCGGGALAGAVSTNKCGEPPSCTVTFFATLQRTQVPKCPSPHAPPARSQGYRPLPSL